MKTRFHVKGFTLSLTLKQTLMEMTEMAYLNLEMLVEGGASKVNVPFAV